MDERRLPCSERRKRPKCIANRDPNDGRRCRAFSGHERHVESVEHDAGLQIGREGPSDDPARPGVENDRKVEKSGQRRQEGDVGHPQPAGSLGHEVAADEIAGGMMVCRLPRVVIGALLRRLTPAIPAARIEPSNPLPANREAIGLQLGGNTLARHRFHAIQRGSCGYGASDRRQRSPRAEAGRLRHAYQPEAETFRTRAMVRMGYMAWCALMNR